jgi:hypothetical protein
MTSPASVAMVTMSAMSSPGSPHSAAPVIASTAGESILATCSQAVTSADSIASFAYRAKYRPGTAASAAVTQISGIFVTWMHSILSIVLFDDSELHWSLTRLLLPLLLLDRSYFESYCSKAVRCQLPQFQSILAKLLSSLLEDMEDNLSSKMRDKLTANIRYLHIHFVMCFFFFFFFVLYRIDF